MRILQICNIRFFNATAWYSFELAKGLIRENHEVLLIVISNSSAHKVAEKQKLPHVCMDLDPRNPYALWKCYKNIKKQIKLFCPDIVHCHRGESFILWGIFRKILKNFKLIRSRGDQRLPRKNFFNKWLYNKISDAVIVSNSRMYDYLQDIFDIPENKLHLVRGGVDTDIFYYKSSTRLKIREELGLLEGEIVFGLVGRFDPIKGQKESIEAISKLYYRDKIQNIRLVISGFNAVINVEEIKRWIKKYKAEKFVTITDRQTDISGFMSAMDVGLVASLGSEAIARVAFEFMACKIPVIASRVGVLPDFIEEENLFTPGDILSQKNIMKNALNSKYRSDCVENQTKKIIEFYSLHEFTKQILEIYKNVLN